MTKKRQRSAKEDGKPQKKSSSAKSKIEGDDDAIKARQQDLSPLQDLYKELVTWSSHPERSSLHQVRTVDQGWIRTRVGPQLELILEDLSATDPIHASVSSNQDFRWLCHLWALLLSYEGQSGRLTAGTKQYVQKLSSNSSSAPNLLRAVFLTLCDSTSFVTSKDLDKNTNFESSEKITGLTTVCHCITLLGHEHETVRLCAVHGSHESTPGSNLMEYIPKNCRDLLERQLKKHDESLLKFKKDEGGSNQQSDDSSSPFLISVIGTILYFVEGGSGESEMDTSDNSSNDSIRNSVFLHRSLEMLIDFLSSSSVLRTFLLFYLRATHFVIRFRRGLARIEQNIPDNDHGLSSSHTLTKQLLERIQQLQRNDPLMLSISGPSSVSSKKSSSLLGWSTSASDTSALRMHYYRRASIFQQICHRYYGTTSKLDDVIFAGLGQLCGDNQTGLSDKFLQQALSSLSHDELLGLLHTLRLIDRGQSELEFLFKERDFLLDVLAEYLHLPDSIAIGDPTQSQTFHTSYLPLFPTESLLWDMARIPPSHSQLLLPSQVLSLPKLYSTQFLSYSDYLWRNFTLLQLETASSIRSDLVNVIRRLRPVLGAQLSQDDDQYNESGMVTGVSKTSFAGWARMALELQDTGLVDTKVEPPLLGELHPRKVQAEFTIDLEPCGGAIRQEWDTLGEHDNVFLVAIDVNQAQGGEPPTVHELRANLGYQDDQADNYGDRLVREDDDPTFPQRFGIQIVRGATIVHIRDQEGTVLTDPALRMEQQPKEAVGTKRVFSVSLDPIQYHKDVRSGKKNMYSSCNLVVRRHGRENSFKAQLETTQQLLKGTDSIGNVLPLWLQPLLLGQGPPDSAHHQSKYMQEYSEETVGVASRDAFLDFGDVFMDEEHLRQAFSEGGNDALVKVDGKVVGAVKKKRGNEEKEASETNRSNYKIRFGTVEDGNGNESFIVEAKSYTRAQSLVGNSVRFTPRQVEAIRSGLSCGLRYALQLIVW